MFADHHSALVAGRRVVDLDGARAVRPAVFQRPDVQVALAVDAELRIASWRNGSDWMRD